MVHESLSSIARHFHPVPMPFLEPFLSIAGLVMLRVGFTIAVVPLSSTSTRRLISLGAGSKGATVPAA